MSWKNMPMKDLTMAKLARFRKPAAACMPCAPNGRSSVAVKRARSVQVKTLRPSWKNMPLKAIIAGLPLAISTASFVVFAA
eukprot:1696379-Heterocapsa_arctica.AAC.1